MDRRTFLAASAALTATSAAWPAFARQSSDLSARLAEIQADNGPPALGAAIVTPEGIVWSDVAGVRRNGEADPVTLHDRWHLGSNTKAMTAALYARLVEQGRAAWGATVPTLFPDLEIDPVWRDITIEHLFGHRAGILDPAVMTAWMMQAWAGTDLSALRLALAQSVFSAPAAGPVGDFAYSNAGYIIAGAAIERLSGEPWEDAMRREIFEPLGMASAGFGPPTGDNAWGHFGRIMRPVSPETPGSDNPPAMGPAGTVHATMADYAKFLRVFMTGGGGWLSTESVAHLTRPLPDEGQGYALGWGVVSGPEWTGGAPALSHDGSNTLWLARNVIAPGRNAALICVANAADPAQNAFSNLTRTLIDAFPA